MIKPRGRPAPNQKARGIDGAPPGVGSVAGQVLKSGGNKYSGLFDYRHTNDGLAGDNVSDEYLKLNANLGTPNVLTTFGSGTAFAATSMCCG